MIKSFITPIDQIEGLKYTDIWPAFNKSELRLMAKARVKLHPSWQQEPSIVEVTGLSKKQPTHLTVAMHVRFAAFYTADARRLDCSMSESFQSALSHLRYRDASWSGPPVWLKPYFYGAAYVIDGRSATPTWSKNGTLSAFFIRFGMYAS